VRRIQDRLADVLDAIEAIERAAARGRDVFDSDEYVQTYIIHHLEIIGEAVRAVGDDLRRRRPEVPWAQIVGMRHILVHHYFGVRLDRAWAVVENDLPELRAAVASLLAELGAARPDGG
jgi:uncharacterized protein with HEPN domain